MLKRFMHNRERHYAMLNDNRVVREFEWGTEFVKENANGEDPRRIFRDYTKSVLRTAMIFSLHPTFRITN